MWVKIRPGQVIEVYVSGNYAYVADGYSGLRIIDVSNPATPKEIGFYDTPDFAVGVYVSGNYAYVADWNSGLRIIDISNPEAPKEISFYDTPSLACEVYVLGNYAYVADNRSVSMMSSLRIIDVSNPEAPKEISFYETPSQSYGGYGVYVSGNYAYVADGDSGLRIVDISNPAIPKEIGFYDTPGLAYGVYVSGNYAYVADFGYGLSIIDISNPATPKKIGFYSMPHPVYRKPTPEAPVEVYVSGNYAYVADYYSGLMIIDISNPTTPDKIGLYCAQDFAVGIYVSGNYAYVADCYSGLRIIDISTPATPAEIGFYDTPGLAHGVYVSRNCAYVADGDSGLRIIDILNPAIPKEIGFYDTPGFAVGVYVSRNCAYVADGDSGLKIVDISNPAIPTEIGFYDTPGLAHGVYVSRNCAYVADGDSGLRIIDVSNPEAPKEIGFYDTPGFAAGVYVSGNYAYVADCISGLRIIDISNPVTPKEIGFYDTPGSAIGVYVSGNYAYVADWNSGLRIIDVSNPEAPKEIGFYDTPGFAAGVYVSGNYAYVADYYDSGLWILEYTGIPILQITTTTLPDGIVNQPYSQILKAANGIEPYTWSIISGTLPPGLDLDPVTGVISGTPTATGKFNFKIEVKDSGTPQQTDTQNLPIIIIPQLTITTTSLSNGIGDQPYYQTLKATGGIKPYRWSIISGDLPTGLNLDPTTGVISGIPITAGTFNFKIQIQDSDTPQQIATQDISISIIILQLTITTTSLSNGVVNQRYYQTLKATGGIKPYTWSIISGTLPSGLTLNTATGLISGIPTTTGEFVFKVEVKDRGTPQQTDTQNLSITITTPILLPVVGSYNTPGLAHGVYVSRNCAYVADGDSGLRIIDISNPAIPKEIGFYDTPGLAYGVYVSGNYAYVADGRSGLRIIDISNPKAPTEIGFYDTPGSAIGVYVSGNYAYVADGDSGLRIIDISNPVTPKEIRFYDASPGSAIGVYVSGNYAYVAGGVPSLKIIDISTPLTPTKIGSYDIPYKALGVYVSGNYAYVANGHAGLRIIDISTPATPTEIGFYDVPLGLACGVYVSGNYAYVAGYDSGLRIIDISNPVTPKEVGFYDTPGLAWGVYVSGNYAYVVDMGSGLWILQYTGIPILQITTTTLPNGMVNQAYSQTLKATGGTAPYRWSIISGTLPSGLALAPDTGLISGTPTQSGSFTFNVQVTDSVGNSTSKELSIYIAPQPVIKPILFSPQSAGSEVWLRIQVGDEKRPVYDLFTLFGTLTWTSPEVIEILKIKPGNFIGEDLQIFEIIKSSGKIEFIMRRKTGTSGVTGYGSILDVKIRISATAQPGTITFGLSDIQAYNSTAQWISLLPKSNQMRVNRVPIKPVVYPPILPQSEFEVDIQVGDMNNDVSKLKSLSFNLQWDPNIIDIQKPVSMNVRPGEFLGTDTFSFAIMPGIGTLSICVGRFTGESNGYGLVAKIRFKVLHHVKPGTKGTFTITNVLAYNSESWQIGLISVDCPFFIEKIPDRWTQVWPGDTDNNGVVNRWDIVPIAFYLGKTGPKRETISIEWKAWLAQYWDIVEPPCPDAVYSDANGDGEVNIKDVNALIINNGRQHSKTKVLSPPIESDEYLLEKYHKVLRSRPDLIENIKYILTNLERNVENQEFIKPLQDLLEKLSQSSEFKVYPNPYYPTTIHSGLGGVKFENLGTDWNIKIYNLAGERIEKISGTENTYIWSEAKNLASGVYIYIIKSSTLGKKRGKLAIIK